MKESNQEKVYSETPLLDAAFASLGEDLDELTIEQIETSLSSQIIDEALLVNKLNLIWLF